MSEDTLFDSEPFGISEAATDIHSRVTPRLVDPRPLRPLSPPLPDIPQGQGTAGTAYEEDSACRIISMNEIMQTHYPDLRWHVPMLFPEGFSLLVGAPKAGKSWLALAIATAAGGGRSLFGQEIEPRPVLYLALEDSHRRLQSRAATIGCEVDTAPLLEVLTTKPADHSVASIIEDWVSRLPIDSDAPLVIVDTLGRVRGRRLANESPYDHDYRIGVAVKNAADAIDGAAVIAVHHDRKAGSADFVDDVSGTNGLAGSADTIVVLRREREESEAILLVTGRDVTEASYAVKFDDGRWSLLGDSWDSAQTRAAEVAASAGRGGLARSVVGYLAGVEDASPKEVADALKASYEAVKKVLQRLYDSGKLQRADGRYSLPSNSGES